jgi:protein-S-isoprenylcysteine O-methyltransferase Ste14
MVPGGPTLLLFKNLLFTVLVPGTVAVLIPRSLSLDRLVPSAAAAAAASAFFLVGAAVYAWCVWDFASFGRGTPAPIDAPKQLVVRGLYHYSRNPMYVGVLTVIVGWGVLYLDWHLFAYAACVATLFQLFIRFYEEPHLAELFGEEYTAYRARVGRWLPRVR